MTTIRFIPMDARAAEYPAPRLPVLPIMSLKTFLGERRIKYGTRFLAPDAIPVRNGRTALAHALRLSNVDPGDRVLIPAFHCGSMIDPALWCGAEVVFFRIRCDLSLDIDDIRGKLDNRTKAIIAPHYFGFPQHLGEIMSLCRRNGIALIEDCAHSFFGTNNTSVLGYLGDFAIASTHKFFPVAEGGILCANPPLK